MGWKRTGVAVPEAIGDVHTFSVDNYNEMGFTIIPRGGALTGAELLGIIGEERDAAFPIMTGAGWAADPEWPVRSVSGDLRTLAEDAIGVVFINTAGLTKVVLRLQAGAGVTLDLYGQKN